jgi:small subunit ribosomal protein S19e
MVNVFDVSANELIEKAAAELVKLPEFKAPDWASFAKTGVSKQRPPTNKEWWQVRVAAILRTVYRMGPIGTSKLRTKYGSKMNRGVAPEHHYKGSGSVIRKALQQLEKAGMIKKGDVKGHKGRVVTGKGKQFLDKLATQIYKAMPKEERTFIEIRVPPPKAPKAEKVHVEALENPKDSQAPENTKRSPGKPVEAAEVQAEQ